MGKKSRPKKPKPLLAVQGILHLQSSFVHPTLEAGLLTTVGGLSEQALVLAPNYGYGIPASTLETNNNENAESTEDNNGTASERKKEETIRDSSSPSSLTQENGSNSNPDDLSVAELVRQIGGAKGKPLRRRDVVEDRVDVLNEQAELAEAEAQEMEECLKRLEPEDNAQTNEFYASIGMDHRTKNVATEVSAAHAVTPDIQNSTDQEDMQVPISDAPTEPVVIENVPESVAEYYKSLNNYYYSAVPDPYSEERLEFGAAIPICEENAPPSSNGVIELARMAQKRKRAMEAAISAMHEAKSKIPKLADREKEAENYDPLPMEIIPSESTASLNITADTGLEQYWDYVKENPHDFNRWTYLIHYAENSRNLNECRLVYSSFLPLFPYCFGYWKRYCELEKGHYYFQRALTILQRGLDFNPLCVDLWLSYLNLFCEIYAHDNDYENIVRQQYEKALSSAGKDFRSDALWDAFIEWEQNQKRLNHVYVLYGRLVQIPTRLYNRHWDNMQALVRDHHPRDFLNKDSYERYRKRGCLALKFKYKPEPEFEPGEIRKTSKPEDQLMNYVKSNIIERFGRVYNYNANQVNKRWDFEDLIRRPYFHIKPLDKRQLHNWEAYLNFEIDQGCHDRIILLFERCLIACAQYESFWCRYGRYMENYHKKNKSLKSISKHVQKSQINVEIVSKKQTEEEEALVEDVEFVLNTAISHIEQQEKEEIEEIRKTVEYIVAQLCEEGGMHESNTTNNDIFKGMVVSDSSVNSAKDSSNLCDHSVEIAESPSKSAKQNVNCVSSASSGLSSLISFPALPPAEFYWQEVVRDIYKRACVIHCARKPACRLQWSAFEEEIGNVEGARQLILHVLEWFPSHLEGKMQLIEHKRRQNDLVSVETSFEEYLSKSESKEEYTALALKYARFLSKEVNKPDKALRVLRKAAKKDKSNPRIYAHIFELCYERFPSDRKGPVAALQIAINCNDLTNEQRLVYAKKMVHFLQEHGDLRRYRDAMDQMYEFQRIVQREREQNAKLRAYDTPNRPESLEAFPVPDWSSVLEKCNTSVISSIPIEFEPTNEDREKAELVDITSEPTAQDEDKAYKETPPTKELLIGSNYGYGSKHPDSKLYEQMSHTEYEKLESKGYAEHLLDVNNDNEPVKRKINSKDPVYIVAPKGSYVMSYLGGPNTAENPPVPGDAKRVKLEAPVQLKMLPMPTEAPCINVPDWFIQEGGELCLSETPRGYSIIRYWPHFISENGNHKLFRSIRKCVKWHQKQELLGNRWRHLTRLVSWLGPCDYSNNGLVMARNENWPPEVLDLLHRIIQMTRHEFNSCFLNLYRTGHDNIGWHSDSAPALGSNPPIGSVSLGALRLFELRRRGPTHNFIRFPLFPGSLLIMEGATQDDWSHQIPKEPNIKDERLNLTFRVMHAIDDIDKLPGYKPVVPRKSKPNIAEPEANSIKPDTTIATNSSATIVTPTDPTSAKENTALSENQASNILPSSGTKIIFHKT